MSRGLPKKRTGKRKPPGVGKRPLSHQRRPEAAANGPMRPVADPEPLSRAPGARIKRPAGWRRMTPPRETNRVIRPSIFR